MNVRDKRDRGLFPNFLQLRGSRIIRHGKAHNLAPGFRQRIDLCDRAQDIAGIGIAHGLDAHRIVATDAHAAYIHGSCMFPLHKRRTVPNFFPQAKWHTTRFANRKYNSARYSTRVW